MPNRSSRVAKEFAGEYLGRKQSWNNSYAGMSIFRQKRRVNQLEVEHAVGAIEGGSVKPIARKCLAGLMLLAALAVTNRLAAQQQPEGSTIVDPGSANPVPLINQPLVPDAAKPGGAGFTLTVNGAGFVSTSVVKWNGIARATIFISKSQL